MKCNKTPNNKHKTEEVEGGWVGVKERRRQIHDDFSMCTMGKEEIKNHPWVAIRRLIEF